MVSEESNAAQRITIHVRNCPAAESDRLTPAPAAA
jgi:hypothetical protein